jgi:hypothetical protein
MTERNAAARTRAKAIRGCFAPLQDEGEKQTMTMAGTNTVAFASLEDDEIVGDA